MKNNYFSKFESSLIPNIAFGFLQLFDRKMLDGYVSQSTSALCHIIASWTLIKLPMDDNYV